MALVLIYWSMALPGRVGLWFAFFSGIVLDTSLGTILGQHTLALVVVIYFNLNFYQRIRVLALAQQAIYVFALLLINQVVVAWVEGIMGRPTPLMAYFGAPLVGMIIWPWVFVILRDIRRKAMLR
jgi:rod shape-determining protein MreD